MNMQGPHCAMDDILRQELERFLAGWPAPERGDQLRLLDALFAYRLLLDRNPDRERELPRLAALAQSGSLREFLAYVRGCDEFRGQVGMIPSGHLLMAELPDFRFWFNSTDSEMGMRMGLGLYEPETVQFFRDVIRPGMTCWDVGAQTGYFTCLFAILCGPEGRVHAYEPMPESHAMILRNVRENQIGERVLVRNMACSDARGAVPMTQTAGMFVVDHRSDQAHSIACVRLDEEGLPSPDLIKIDVEGHEPSVLRGLEGVLERCNPLLVVELNEYWLRTHSGTGGAEVVRGLNERGFVVSLIESPEVALDWRQLSQGALGNVNVLARRAA